MISILIHDPDKEEMTAVISSFKNELFSLSDEENRFLVSNTIAELYNNINVNDIGDLCFVSFDEIIGRQLINQIRDRFPSISVMLCVDENLSPKTYIRPGILASTVLFRPFSEDELNDAVCEYISGYLDNRRTNSDDIFLIESKDGIVRVPYEQIHYFEATSKKIFVYLQREDYCFYSTLDSLENNLPNHFVRCHRSYIVNTHKVKKYNATEYVVELENGLWIPVSRKYRELIQESIR